MDIVAAVVIVLLVIATGVVVIGVFIWAAVKDGQEDKALQARLRIRLAGRCDTVLLGRETGPRFWSRFAANIEALERVVSCDSWFCGGA